MRSSRVKCIVLVLFACDTYYGIAAVGRENIVCTGILIVFTALNPTTFNDGSKRLRA